MKHDYDVPDVPTVANRQRRTKFVLEQLKDLDALVLSLQVAVRVVDGSPVACAEFVEPTGVPPEEDSFRGDCDQMVSLIGDLKDRVHTLEKRLLDMFYEQG